MNSAVFKCRSEVEQWRYEPFKRLQPSAIAKIAKVLQDDQLEMIAASDVFWDTISSIESIGTRPVYDATVLETHNFIANGTNLQTA